MMATGPSAPMRAIARRLGRQSVAYGLASMVGPGTGLLLLPLYTRYLSPADYGLIALLEIVALLLATVFSLGMTAMVPFYFVDEPDPACRRRRVGSLLIGVTAVNIVLTALVVAVGPQLVGLLLPSVPFTPFVPILALTALLEPYWIVTGAILQIQERAGRYSALSSARVVLSMALRVTAVVVFEGGVIGFILANLATAAVTMAAVLPLLRSEATLAFDLRDLTRALRVGGPTVPNNLLSYGFRAIDRVVMDRFVTREQIGIYYLALRLADVLRLAADVFISAWRPVFFKEAGDPRFAAVVVPDVIRLVSVVFVAVFLVVSLFAREAVVWLLAPGFEGAAAFVPVLLAAMAIKGLYAFPYLVIWYRKRTAYVPVLTLIALLVSVGANLLLTPHFGTWGIATALVLSWSVLFGLVLAVALRWYPLVYPWRPIAIAGGTAVAVVAATATLEPGSVAVAVKLALVGVWAGGLVVTGCVTIAEVHAIGAPLRRLARRLQPAAP